MFLHILYNKLIKHWHPWHVIEVILQYHLLISVFLFNIKARNLTTLSCFKALKGVRIRSVIIYLFGFSLSKNSFTVILIIPFYTLYYIT